MKVILRKIHRWLGLLMALQIVAWMASGFYFALFPIEEIRGEHLTHVSQPLTPAELQSLPPPASVIQALDREVPGIAAIDGMVAQRRGGQAVWRVSGQVGGEPFRRVVAGAPPRVLAGLSETQARALAGELLTVPARVAAVEWVTEVGKDSEYRGKPLPVWRVRFSEPEGLHLYLDAWTGEVTARRTDRWRIFDFLWMLHIMDFSERSDFNTPLLQLAALLGLTVALSGVVFWTLTTRLWRRKQKARP